MAEPASSRAHTVEAAVLRGFVLGTLVGSVVVFLLWGGAAFFGGLDGTSATAVGIFTTIWGGPGFGGMLGAVLGYTRFEEHEKRSRTRAVEAAG